jgi:hypothetical protein
MKRSVVVRALGALALFAVASPLVAQRPQFAPTLSWDAGLINTPAAYVSPLTGDLALNYARLGLDSAKGIPGFAAKNTIYSFSASVALYGRAEVGVSVFTGDLKAGLFGKFLVWDQTDAIWRTGLLHWLPSAAIGVRNIGSEKQLDRLGEANSGTNLSTVPTFYGVLTRTFVLKAAEEGTRPKVQLALSAGYGNGLFKDDAGLGKAYAKSATGGAFGGAQLQFLTGKYSSISLLAEQDGWDVNAGAQLDIRGIRAALYMMELGAGSGQRGSLAYSKVALSIGWQTNFSALIRGNRMEQLTERYDQRADELRKQIAAGEARVNAIEAQLKSLKAVAASSSSAERADLEARLREEQAALKRLQEQLKAAQAAKKP